MPRNEIDWIQQVKNKPFVDVREFGAKGDGTTDDSDAIQDAIDFACYLGDMNFGNKPVVFPQGTYKITKDITVANSGISLLGVKNTKITRSGAGIFFNFTGNGFLTEIANLAFIGDGTTEQYALKFTGTNIGFYWQGPLNAFIHDCYFEGIGNPDIVSNNTGGAIYCTSQCLGMLIIDNIFTAGGFGVKVLAGSDGLTVRGNVSNKSKSFFIQFINTLGSQGMEVSRNNVGNIGGLFYGANCGRILINNNTYVPGEAEGTAPDMIKYDITELDAGNFVEDVAGKSMVFYFRNAQSLEFRGNSASLDYGVGSKGDYCYYNSNYMSPGTYEDNTGNGATLAIFKVGPQAHRFINNHALGFMPDGITKMVLYDEWHPGIIHFGWDGLTDTNYWGFGTTSPTAPIEFAVPYVNPTDGAGMLKISNKDYPEEILTMGYNHLETNGYIQAYKNGVGYVPLRFRSPATFYGASGDTAITIQAGSGQGSNLLRVLSYAGTELFKIGPTGALIGSINAGSNLLILQNGTSLPATCVAYREMFFNTITGKLYFAINTDVWKEITLT